ncbi:hypothetical protein ACFSTC_54215 [Nonomuraea ferruginea]
MSRAPAMRTVPFDGLSAAELDAWHALRAANPALDSPYFHPGFAAAVHASGRPVHVAVSTRDGGIDALVPHHRDGRVLRPHGWPGADFQGPVLAAGTPFRPLGLLSRGGPARTCSTTWWRPRPGSGRGCWAAGRRRTWTSPAGCPATWGGPRAAAGTT